MSLVIRASHDPEREHRALEAWRSRHSLVDRVLRLKARDPQRALALAVHMERWGWPGLAILEDIAAIPPPPRALTAGGGGSLTTSSAPPAWEGG